MRLRLRSSTRWLVPPTLRTVEESEDRHASWLELFFDLVFVVAVAGRLHLLELDQSAGGVLRFAALFVLVPLAGRASRSTPRPGARRPKRDR